MVLRPLGLVSWGSLAGQQACWPWTAWSMQNGIRPCSLLHQRGPAKSPGASAHGLSKTRDKLSSARNPCISEHFATPIDVPVPQKSTHKEW